MNKKLIVVVSLFFGASIFVEASVPRAISGSDPLSGKNIQIEIAKTSAQPVVVVFLSAKCPCSNSHEQTLAHLYQTYSAKGFQFVAVHSNEDESIELVRDHFKNRALPFPLVQDTDSRLANELGALKTPHVFVIKNGDIVFQGGVDDSKDSSKAESHFLEAALQDLDQRRLPRVSSVRTLGCIIKRKN